MGKAGLALLCPFAIDSVAIAYKNPCPVPDQFLKNLLGAAGLDAEEGHRCIDHHPQPCQDSMLLPGSLVHEIHFATARFGRNGFIVGKDRLRNPIHATLNSSTTDGNSQHRVAELLHSASTAALTSTQLSNEAGKPWPVSNPETLRNQTLTDPSTSPAPPFLQNEIGKILHRHPGPLQFQLLFALCSIFQSPIHKNLGNVPLIMRA
jgi:hypothetical protein